MTTTTAAHPQVTFQIAADLLRWRADEHPQRTAVNVEGAAALTFGQWELRSNAAAHRLIKHGVRPGDRVALLFGERDWADYAVAYFGVLKTSATAVHLSTGMRVA